VVVGCAPLGNGGDAGDGLLATAVPSGLIVHRIFGRDRVHLGRDSVGVL
jgi:hypothetical protein